MSHVSRSLGRRFVLAVALSLVAAPAALAQPARSPVRPSHEGRHLAYPATAAAFRARVTERIADARARMERHIADQKIGREQAEALRTRFQAAVVELGAKVDAVCSDGTVTVDEAKAVRALAKVLRAEWKEAEGGSTKDDE
jgi:hypothetical protein